MPNFIWISNCVAYEGRKTSNMAVFSTSTFCDGAALQYGDNIERDAQLGLQEAYYISKTKSPNKKILLSSVLCSFKFPVTMDMVCFYLTFELLDFLLFSLCLLYFVVCLCCNLNL